MLQIDRIYEIFAKLIYIDFMVISLPNGVPDEHKSDVSWGDFTVLGDERGKRSALFFYDQEPLIDGMFDKYAKVVSSSESTEWSKEHLWAKDIILVTSEKSNKVNDFVSSAPKRFIRNLNHSTLYYFFHGFASLDWFRAYHALNHNKKVVRDYKFDYQSFNRIVTGARAYRKTFVDQLRSDDLLKHGAVSYGVTDDPVTEERLVIDQKQLPGSASADIPDVDAFWHIVTETVFYHDKLHLTEKIFKPIVSKQPFMLLAAPGNLEYLRSYGFKTFEGIIDESYDSIKDNDARINAVVSQLKWYCDLSDDEKTEIQRKCEPIVEHNFQHFYGKFREIITDELLDNTKKLFDEIGYDDSEIDYDSVRQLLT